MAPKHILLAAALFMLLTCSAPLAPSSASQGEPNPIRVAARPTATPRATATPRGEPAPTKPKIAPTSATRLAPTPSMTNDQVTQAIDRYLSTITTQGAFGGAVLVARGDTVLLARGYGPADATGANPNTQSTHFRLASITKQFTAVATLILVQQEKLRLDDPICQYLSDCPDTWKPITIRHLLNHSSGLYDYTDSLDFEATEGQPTTPQELVARFRNQPLGFNPGDYYDYCNSGYVLLGLIIERASGMSYGDFIKRAIFEPLGMQQSSYDSGNAYDPTQAFPFRRVGQPATFLNTTTLYAAGGLVSTVEDLYRWDQALYSDQLLNNNLRTEMFTPGNGSYGFGWKIERPNGFLRISHAGNMTGVSNFIARYPEQRVTVIVLSNVENTNGIGISDTIANMVLNGS